MLHPTARRATPIRPPTNTARPASERVAGEGLRVLVTDTPAHIAGHACTPAMAAWLIATGAAVALVDEDRGDRRQWLHLPPTAMRQPDPASEHAVGGDLVGELYAERFAAPPQPPRPSRPAARTVRGGSR